MTATAAPTAADTATASFDGAASLDGAAPPRFERRLLELLLAERRLLQRLALIAGFSILLGAATPYATRIAIDQALPDAAPSLLLVVTLGFIVLVVHRAWASWLQSLTSAQLQASVERGALVESLRALVRSDLHISSQRDAGWMLSTLRGAGSSAQAYVSSFTTLFTRGLSALVYLFMLGSFSPTVALVVVAADLVIALATYLFACGEARCMEVELERSSVEQSRLQLLVRGLAALRGLFASERMAEEWSARVRATGEAGQRSARMSAWRSLVISLGEQALSVGIMVWAAVECFRGVLSIGSMTFVMAIAASSSSSVLAVINLAAAFRAMRPNLDRVDQLLLGESRSTASVANPVQTDDHIRLRGVTLRYSSDSAPVFAGYDWSLERGQTVHLQAASGTGKTTLLRLLAGLLPPTRGRVTVFGVDAARARSLVLYVPQHCRLFETTIRENLELLSGASMTEVRRVAQLTGLAELLRRLPMAEETPVSSGGTNLSSGQRQLIVLTAAFASSRPVLLLDEATSQIDLETRRRCQWGPLLAGRTVIRVEHG